MNFSLPLPFRLRYALLCGQMMLVTWADVHILFHNTRWATRRTLQQVGRPARFSFYMP